MSFLSNLSSYGQLSAKAPRVQLKSDADRFEENATEQIDLLESGVAESLWFKVSGDEHTVVLRNGVKPIPLGNDDTGKPLIEMKLAGRVAAMAYIRDAIAAAKAGEFNELFKATAKKASKKGA